MAEPGAELGIPTPPLAEDAQPAANASDAGDQAGRNKRRGRPRPRGGQRERERRQRQAQREQDPGGNGQQGDDGATGAAESGAVGAAGDAAPAGGGNRRGGRDGRGRGRSGGGRGGGGRGPRLAWRSAVDEATGQPLTREQLWETATSAAEAAAASKAAAPAAEEGGEPTAGGDAAAGGNATGGSDGAQRSQPGLWGEDQQAAADAKAEAEDNEGKDPFEAGHIVEVAKDPRTGEVLGVREIWLAPSARRRPRRSPAGGNASAGAEEGQSEEPKAEGTAAEGKPEGAAAEHHDDQQAAAERLMSELGV